MISNITIYFYKSSDKTIIHQIDVVHENGTESTFKLNYKNNKLDDEIKKMKDILTTYLKYLKKQTGLSSKKLQEKGLISYKNVEILSLNNLMQKNDNKFVNRNIIFDTFTCLGNLNGIVGFSFLTYGLLCQTISNFEYKKNCDNYDELVDKIEKKYDIKQNKNALKKRKMLFRICLLLNLAISSITITNKISDYKPKYEKEAFNPLDDKYIDNLTNEQIVGYLKIALYNNKTLKEKDKNILESICEYALDSEYIDLKELYKDLSTLIIYDADYINIDGNYIKCAEYFRKQNFIVVYGDLMDRNIELQHECIHSTGNFENEFINEGMTSLLQREYYADNKEVDGYTRNVNTVRLLCEIVGSDIILEAYNTYNDDLLYNELSKIYGDYETAENTIKLLNNITKYSTYGDNQTEIAESCKIILKNFKPYIDNCNGDRQQIDKYLNAIIYKSDQNDKYYFNKNKIKILYLDSNKDY